MFFSTRVLFICYSCLVIKTVIILLDQQRKACSFFFNSLHDVTRLCTTTLFADVVITSIYTTRSAEMILFQFLKYKNLKTDPSNLQFCFL